MEKITESDLDAVIQHVELGGSVATRTDRRTGPRLPVFRTDQQKYAMAKYQQLKKVDVREAQRFAWECRIKSQYGLSPEAFARIYERQDHKCAICRAKLHLDHMTHIDHSHKTNNVRGLLCAGCNSKVGAVESCDLNRILHYIKSRK